MGPHAKTLKIDLIESQLLKTPPYAIQTFSQTFGFPAVSQGQKIFMGVPIACPCQD
jgi:hypothetical protein